MEKLSSHPSVFMSRSKTAAGKSDGSKNIGQRRVPHAKKPRSRPPNTVRDSLGFLHGTLPKYSGPYSVGIMEIEVPAEKPRTFSDITRDKQHLLKLETVLMCIYYPCAIGSGIGPTPDGTKKWSRQTWLPRPRYRTAKGFGIFAGVNQHVAVPLLAGTTMFTKLPAFRNAAPATHWPPETDVKGEGWKGKDRKGKPPPGCEEEPQFPTLVFSHGLGGSRTCYSSVCGEFASYGFVVCAIEHRDGSGPRTYINHEKQGEGSFEEREEKGDMDHHPEERKKGYGRVDYIFPKDNPLDTSPHNEKGVDAELRKAQIDLRLAEIEEGYRVLRHISSGNGSFIARRNLRRKGFVGASSHGLNGVDWAQWKHRFHLNEVTIAGHSFGAATTTEVLRRASHFPWVGQGIIYDIWGAVVEPSDKAESQPINLPLLAINSEAFMYWPSNFDTVMNLVDEACDQGAPTWLLTLRGTVHLTQSDLSILYPTICSLYLGMTANPKRALDLNISASLEFLKKIMPSRSAILHRAMTDEGILEVEVVDDVPEEHKPPEEWIAVRLDKPEGLVATVVPKLVRKGKRWRRRGEKGADIKVGPAEEIWMHKRCGEGVVERYLDGKVKGQAGEGVCEKGKILNGEERDNGDHKLANGAAGGAKAYTGTAENEAFSPKQTARAQAIADDQKHGNSRDPPPPHEADSK